MTKDHARDVRPLTAADDPWLRLRGETQARVGLGRSGVSVPTSAILRFGADHAFARDAVWSVLDEERLAGQLEQLGLQPIFVASQARDRSEYLARPDFGRELCPSSMLALQAMPVSPPVAVVLADGLSAQATQCHASGLVQALLPLVLADLSLRATDIAVLIARHARVGLSDAIGAACGVRLVIMLIGERPGLSAADSLGAYLTYAPRPGRSDADRNCVSNIRPGGLDVVSAAQKIAYLGRSAWQHQLSGVALKDESAAFPDPRSLEP